MLNELSKLSELNNLDVSKMPLANINDFEKKLTILESWCKLLRSRIDNELSDRLVPIAVNNLSERGSEFGTVTVICENMCAKVAIPKTVVWNQNVLEQLSKATETELEPLAACIKSSFKIDERDYKNLPNSLKQLLEEKEARSLKAGKPKVTI